MSPRQLATRRRVSTEAPRIERYELVTACAPTVRNDPMTTTTGPIDPTAGPHYRRPARSLRRACAARRRRTLAEPVAGEHLLLRARPESVGMAHPLISRQFGF
jgi:hypothetical protein